jgi:drug/metabolite transporter (DMT)-like permease
VSQHPAAAHARTHRTRLIVAFATVYLLWGSTFLAIRIAVETIPPFFMAGMRHLTAGLVLCAWMLRRGAPRPSASEWKVASIVGVLLLLGGNGIVSWAELRVPSGITALLVATVPVWMVIVDWLRPGGARPHAGVFAGLVLGMTGLVILVGPGEFMGHGVVDATGALALVLGSLSWAIGSIYSQRAERPRSPLLATGMQMVAGGAALIVAGAIVGEGKGFSLAQVTLHSGLGWAYLVVFGSLIGFTAYAYLLGATTAAKVATYAYVNPVVAVLLGWALAGEEVTPRTLIAAAVILGGVAIITVARSGRAKPLPEEAIGD